MGSSQVCQLKILLAVEVVAFHMELSDILIALCAFIILIYELQIGIELFNTTWFEIGATSKLGILHFYSLHQLLVQALFIQPCFRFVIRLFMVTTLILLTRSFLGNTPGFLPVGHIVLLLCWLNLLVVLILFLIQVLCILGGCFLVVLFGVLQLIWGLLGIWHLQRGLWDDCVHMISHLVQISYHVLSLRIFQGGEIPLVAIVDGGQ